MFNTCAKAENKMIVEFSYFGKFDIMSKSRKWRMIGLKNVSE